MRIIVAVDKRYAIAKDNKLLAHLYKDLQFFKMMTMGHHIIMGRKTIETLPGQKLLPGRKTIILTRDPFYKKFGAIIIHSVPDLLQYLKDQNINEEQVYIAGGESIYEQLLPYAKEAYVTEIDHDFEGDQFIQDFRTMEDWVVECESSNVEDNGFTYRWMKYVRK